jgi:hypothetical protein
MINMLILKFKVCFKKMSDESKREKKKTYLNIICLSRKRILVWFSDAFILRISITCETVTKSFRMRYSKSHTNPGPKNAGTLSYTPDCPETIVIWAVTHPSTNWARRCLTLFTGMSTEKRHRLYSCALCMNLITFYRH